MNSLNNILTNCSLFYNINPADFSSLLTCIHSYTKKYQPDEYIFLSGDQINYVGIILSGSIEIGKESPSGGNHIVNFLGSGNLFGEGIVCTNNRISPVTVKSKDITEILFIPYETIIKSCNNSCNFHMQLIKNMMMILGEKNLILNHKIELLMLKGMREKLATYLINEYLKEKHLTFSIIPNRNQLAEYLNVSRTSMCRELARMKVEHIIDYYQNSFKIVNIDELTKYTMY